MTVKLYDIFNHWQDTGVIWIYSDPHFNDAETKYMNPNWPSDEDIVKKINSKVGKKDTLIILGDIGDESFVKQLKGYKVLLLGNHDRGVSNYKKKFTVLKNDIEFNTYELYEFACEDKDYLDAEGCRNIKILDNRLFDEVYDGPLFISPKICLSHEPIKLPFGINIHGHVHNGEKYIYYANESVQINVCSDVRDFMPVRLDKLIEGYKTTDLHRVTINKATKNSIKNK